MERTARESLSARCPTSSRYTPPRHGGAGGRGGDALHDGSRNPAELLKLKGATAIELYLVDEVQKVYKSQGVDIHDKHIELIIRQMMKKVRVDTPGDTDLLPGERPTAPGSSERTIG